MDISLVPQPPGGGGSERGLGSRRAQPLSHCNSLSSVHEGSTLIDFAHSFAVKQMARPWFPLGGRLCCNRCCVAPVSPLPFPSPQPRISLTAELRGDKSARAPKIKKIKLKTRMQLHPLPGERLQLIVK